MTTVLGRRKSFGRLPRYRPMFQPSLPPLRRSAGCSCVSCFRRSRRRLPVHAAYRLHVQYLCWCWSDGLRMYAWCSSSRRFFLVYCKLMRRSTTSLACSRTSSSTRLLLAFCCTANIFSNVSCCLARTLLIIPSTSESSVDRVVVPIAFVSGKSHTFLPGPHR